MTCLLPSLRASLRPLVATLLWLAVPALASAPPPTLRTAEELAALPDGHWLVLEKRQLRLLDAGGHERATLAIRGKALDTRPSATGVLAALIDADTQESLLIDVDTVTGRLAIERRLPSPDFPLETLCLYRDDQGHTHLYQLGKLGLARQWLIAAGDPRLVRRLAVPPEVEHCRADDANNLLFLSERGFGLWVQSADGEGSTERRLITARRPWGSLAEGAGAIAVLADGVAVLDSAGRQLQHWQARGGTWRLLASVRVAGEALLASSALLLRDKSGWHAAPRIRLPARPTALTRERALPTIAARVQTDPVGRHGDAADDPALWLHPQDRSRSLVLATNKKQGLLSYDLAGKQQQLLPVGRLNNVDVRQDVRFGSRRVDLALATQRDEKALAVFEIDGEGRISDAGRIATGLRDIYGTCLYRPADGGLEVFANDKDGRFEHYRLEADEATGGYRARRLRAFRLSSQPEGCVADDRRGHLFVGEEKRGIWRLPAQAEAGSTARLILPVGRHLKADVEGLALYDGVHGRYLIASSQGDSSYVVLDAEPPHAVRGSFRIGLNADAGIDGVSDTDGLEASAADLGGAFTGGVLVVQDGYKLLPDGAQNFKLVPWEDIARALQLP